MVAEDLLPDLVVAAERGRADIVVRADAVDLGAAQELGVLDLEEHLGRGHRGVEGDPDVPFDHLGVDELAAALAGDGDSVVAVLDEVDLSHLVELDGRRVTSW